MSGKTPSRGSRRNSDQCSFCGRTAQQVKRLIAGPEKIFICNECVEVCSTLLGGDDGSLPVKDKTRKMLPGDHLTPVKIKAHLDEEVVGQEQAKRIIAVAVYNHYKRLRNKRLGKQVEIEKSNILLLGPTGCGKTLIARSLARLLDVPFAIGDATTITEAGYVGEDVENLLLRLIQSADFDIERAQTGILYIDEIDKIAKTGGNVSITRDVSGEGVQQSLLKLIEGTTANVPPTGGRKHPEQKYLSINTEDILFVCGGAFSGLGEIVARRTGDRILGFRFDDDGNQDFGPSAEEEEDALLAKVIPEDLVHFGLIPEFVGRLPVITALEPLGEDALVSILTEPRNALVKQYQTLCEMDGAELHFTDEALRLIARQARERRTGARALRSILEGVMLDIMYELPERVGVQSRVEITPEVIEGLQSPFADEAPPLAESASTGGKSKPVRRAGKQRKESA